MSEQLFQDLLASLKRSNKERKLKLAEKAGFKTIEEYKMYLEGQIAGKPEKTVVKKTTKKKETVKPTIHIVDIIDCSGSMSGSKIRNAIRGINNGIQELKKDDKVNYTYTLCNFSGAHDIDFKYLNTSLDEVDPVYFHDRGMTALYDAIGITLDKVKNEVLKGEKVLVNIYTDGGENGSYSYNSTKVSEMIEALKENFTVTFIGTDADVDNVISRLKIDESNTLKYDGSADGLAKGMQVNSVARSFYSASVAKGEDVSIGFYKNVIKK